MNPTTARNLACRLATEEPKQALMVARAIDANWFRCQALSHVARYWPDDKYREIIIEASHAAFDQDKLFNQIYVSAWPIRAYLERGDAPPAEMLITSGVRASAEIENMGSRSEALFSIFQASKPFSSNLWQPVLNALIEASEPTFSWRQLRNLKRAIAMVVVSNPELARQSLEIISEPKNISKIRRYIDEGIILEPRPYFWTK